MCSYCASGVFCEEGEGSRDKRMKIQNKLRVDDYFGFWRRKCKETSDRVRSGDRDQISAAEDLLEP